MIKAYAEPNRHFVEVKLGTEEMSDPSLVFSEIYSILEDVVKQINHQVGDEIPLSAFCQAIADAAKHEEETYAPTNDVPVNNILNFEEYVRTHKK